MALGLFDVVGPVMHGPSSNHTGGANRIGYCMGKLMGGCPNTFTLLFHPAYMRSYKGQATHTAMVAGCLGYREYDAESTESLRLAEEKGIQWDAKAYEPAESRNTMGIFAVLQGEEYEIIADSVGGGSIVIQSINGIPVFLTGNEYVQVLYTRDSKEAALFSEAAQKVYETQGKGLCRLYAGTGTDGREVICLATLKAVPLNFTPVTGELCQLDPLYTFCDKGHEPLLSTMADALVLSEKLGDLSEVALQYEQVRGEVSREQVLEQALFMVEVIRASLAKGSTEDLPLLAGLADSGDGKRILAYANSGKTLLDPLFALSMARAAILAEMNGAACRIVASPTGGAAGTLPAAILTVGEHLGSSDEAMARAFLVAALIGVIMGNKASFSGTVGGCQAEVGIGAAMGAAAVTWLAGGTAEQVIQASALTIKNLLGLSCDPPAPCTEVPCIKRNAMGVAAVFFGTELALAGVRSAIEPDDVVSALADTQKRLPTEIKFGGTGGLAGTPSGQALRARWQEKQTDAGHAGACHRKT